MEIFYLQLAGAICVGMLIAWAIVSVVERLQCNRVDGGYKCKGENCEGCYRRMLDGTIVWENPQPLNNDGNAELTPWLGR